MNTTRRQFVAASAATLPALLCVSDVEVGAAAQPAPADDQVLRQIETDVVRAHEELVENSRRVDALRSFESSLRFHAAYTIAAQLDDKIVKSLKRQIKARGRAQWIDDLTADQHHAHRRIAEIQKRHPGLQLDPRLSEFRPMKREDAEQALDQFLKLGTAPYLVALADGVQKLREQAAAQPADHVVRAARQFGFSFCEQMKIMADALEFMVSFVCSLSVLDPFLIPECIVLGIELGTAQFIVWAACS